MPYLRPIVQVFQEYAKMSVSTEDATLTPCVVGPCYQLMEPAKNQDLVLSSVGNYTTVGFTEKRIPNIVAGGKIVADSVYVFLKNPVVTLNESVDVETFKDNSVTFASGPFATIQAKVGDIVKIINVDVPATPVELATDFRVIGVNTTTRTVILNRAITGTHSLIKATIRRKIEDITILSTAANLTVDAAGQTFTLVAAKGIIDGSEYPVSIAECYVGYKALVEVQPNKVYNVEEAKAKLGKLVPGNPLGYGTLIALANTTTGVRIAGVPSDDVEGFTTVKDRLETIEDVYGIAVLSQEPEILGIFKAHAEQMSVPEVGLWRVAVGSTKLETEKIVEKGSGKVFATGNGERIGFSDPDANFLSKLAKPGDTLFVKDKDDVETKFTISSVISEDIVLVSSSTPFANTGFPEASPNTLYGYYVLKSLNLQEQAEGIADTAKSYGSKRFVHVWPDVVVSEEGEDLPGYYLACAVVGMTGGLPSHQGFTRISIAGVGGLKHSNNYFNQEQLDVIAGGGNFIFQQLTPGSVPFIRHQLTTEMSTIELREFSFVKNFDYVSKICKDTLDRFLGKWNITPQTLGVLETSMAAVMESLKLYNLPQIGSPILGYNLTQVKQHDDIRDRVEIYVEVDFPYPLNTIGLHIISR